MTDFTTRLPRSLYRAEQVRQLDAIAIKEFSIPGFTLMKRAAASALEALLEAWRGGQPASRVAPARRTRSLAKAFGEGFLTNALNPKVSMFYLAAFPQFVPAEGALQAAVVLVLLHCLINLAWFGGMILLFGRLSRLAAGAGLRRMLKALTGIVFIGFGARLALLRP